MWNGSVFNTSGPTGFAPSPDGGGRGRGGGTTAPPPPAPSRGGRGRGSARSRFGDAALRALGGAAAKGAFGAYGRMAIWAYRHDPSETTAFSKALDDYLNRSRFGRGYYSAVDWFHDPNWGSGSTPGGASGFETVYPTDTIENFQQCSGVAPNNSDGSPHASCNGQWITYTGGCPGQYPYKVSSCGPWYFWYGNFRPSTVVPGYCDVISSYEFTVRVPCGEPRDFPYLPLRIIPATEPKPLPMPWAYTPPEPYVVPWEEPEYFPDEPARSPNDGLIGRLDPARGVSAGYMTPSVDYHLQDDGGKGPIDGEHPILPPPRKTPERKRVFPRDHPIARMFGNIGEFKDGIDALASALPGEPCKGKALAQKTLCVMQHLPDYTDPKTGADAFWNLVANELQDRAFGKYGQLMGKQNRRLYNKGLIHNSPFGHVTFGGACRNGPSVGHYC